MGIEVEACKVSQHGIKYDREWGVFNKESLKPITQAAEVKYTIMRQKIEKDTKTKQKFLVFYIIDGHDEVIATLPSKELRISINELPQGEVIDTGKVKGISEGEVAEKWFTAFLGEPAILMRSAPGFIKGLPRNILRWSTEEDQSKSFLSKAALHIINEASVRDLTKRVLANYPDQKDRDLIKVTAMAFRPNIVIDTGVAYEEDKMQEARVANTFIRLVGFCSRCKAVANNYETCDRNPELEPNPTLNKYRKHELGVLFGTYH